MFGGVFFPFLLVFLLIAGPLHAEGNIHYGQIQINPYFNFRQEYRSNVFLTAEDEIGDFITYFTPGISFYLPSPDGDSLLDYHTDLLSYWDNDGNNTQRQSLRFKGDWQIGKQYEFLLEDLFEITDDPATSELTFPEDRTRNRFNTFLYWQGRRTGLEGGFTSIRDDYRKFNELDRIENFFTLIGSYRIFPKINGLLQYRYGTITYDEAALNRDASYNELTGGVKGTFSPKVTGELRAGSQWRNYEKGLKDSDGVVIYANITHQLNPRVQTILSLERGFQEASFTGSNYYDYTRFGLDYKHIMGRKYILKAGVGYERDDFSQATRGTDSIWNLSLGWDYNIQSWITTGIGYRFRNRDSLFVGPPDYDYTDHVINLHCNLAF